MTVYKSDCSSSWSVYTDKVTKGKLLPVSYPLRIATIAGSYKDVLHIGNSNLGVSSIVRNIYDGIGTASNIKVSLNRVEINTNGGTISDPIISSSVTFLSKINLSDSVSNYSVDLKSSSGILLYYDNESSTTDLIANINLESDNLFSNLSSAFDEGLIAEVVLQISKNSNRSMTINLSCTYKESSNANPFTIFIPDFPNFYMQTTKIMVIVTTFPAIDIIITEITNA